MKDKKDVHNQCLSMIAFLIKIEPVEGIMSIKQDILMCLSNHSAAGRKICNHEARF